MSEPVSKRRLHELVVKYAGGVQHVEPQVQVVQWRELELMARELLAARPLLEAVKGAGEALEAAALQLDDKATTHAYDDFDRHATRKMDEAHEHAAQLRRIRELVGKT